MHTPRKKNESKKKSPQDKKKGVMKTRRLSDGELVDEQVVAKEKPKKTKKVLYIEIDDEITAIYDRLKQMRLKNLYLVVPKRAVLFQSIVNLKILKRKAEELGKNIYIVTNDNNGIHLASKIGLPVYDKLEGHEHPSLVSGKLLEDQQDITPLKASINALEDDTPTRRKEKKYSLTELLRRKKKAGIAAMTKNMTPGTRPPKQKKTKNKEEKSKFVVVAPNRHALVSLIIVSLLILVTITYIALPGATIALTPKSDVVETSVNITLADIETNKAELDTHPVHMIPSYTMMKKIQKVFTYQATGKEFQGKNASGTITIVNEANHEWPLVAKTRFQTGDGLVFRIANPVEVPAANTSEPGTLDVTVVADEFDEFGQVIGERGNIEPTKFFLPGLSAENQERLYAESTQPFTGGETVVIKKITVEDIEAARAKMESDLKAAAEAELQSYVKERNESQKTNLELLTGRDAVKTSDPVIDIPGELEGQKLETFEVHGEIVASGTAYNRDDLLSILKTELKLKKNPEKRLYKIDEESLSYRIIDTEEAAKKIKITATIKGVEEYEISPEKENGQRLIKKIKDHILGKEVQEAELYIQNLPEIDKVHIESWPAWSPTVPSIPDNIKIEVRRS